MTLGLVKALRSVDIGLADVPAAEKFFTETWNLKVADRVGDVIYLRGSGEDHHLLALHPRPGAPMALNFLPDRLVIVVRAADIVATLDDFWTLVRARFGSRMPRGLCLAAGPSTSADVAMTFATGVHGPVELHALVV